MRRGDGLPIRAVLYLLLAAAVAAAALGFVEDVRNTREYGGVDLRNRVVGARVMLEGLDPYRFKWSQDYPDTLLDPIDNPDNEVSRVTVPPTLLILHMPLAGLPYRFQRTAWLYLQWLLLLASLLLFSRCARSGNQALAIWAVGLLLSATSIWRFHVERGQVYILYVFLIALSLWMSRRPWRYAALTGGLALGLAASLRPTLALMAIPLLVFRKWKLSAGLAAGLAFSVLLSALLFGAAAWRDYAGAMRHHERDNLGLAQTVSDKYAGMTVEGMDDLGSRRDFATVNTSVQWSLKRYYGTEVASGALLLMLGPLLLLLTLYLLGFRAREVSLETAYLAGAAAALLSEYFLPAVKPYYVNIMWLAPASLTILSAGALRSVSRRLRAAGMFLLIAGGLLTLCSFRVDDLAPLGEGLIVLFFLCTGACLVAASPARRAPGAAAEEAGPGISAGEKPRGPEGARAAGGGEAG